ncbi:hypothetical protein NGM37_35275, partial [Streptomyces sp. TRM76130]|nr:hypothetical protein [Streptomyces sp. TRM76130]
TWAAFRWFVGEAPFPELGTPHGDVDEETGLAEWYETAPWEEGAAPVALWRRHAEQVKEWYAVPSRVRRLRLDEDDERQQRAREWQRAEDALKQTRNAMRMQGLTPPRLPDELAEQVK